MKKILVFILLIAVLAVSSVYLVLTFKSPTTEFKSSSGELVVSHIVVDQANKNSQNISVDDLEIKIAK